MNFLSAVSLPALFHNWEREFVLLVIRMFSVLFGQPVLFENRHFGRGTSCHNQVLRWDLTFTPVSIAVQCESLLAVAPVGPVRVHTLVFTPVRVTSTLVHICNKHRQNEEVPSWVDLAVLSRSGLIGRGTILFESLAPMVNQSQWIFTTFRSEGRIQGFWTSHPDSEKISFS